LVVGDNDVDPPNPRQTPEDGSEAAAEFLVVAEARVLIVKAKQLLYGLFLNMCCGGVSRGTMRHIILNPQYHEVDLMGELTPTVSRCPPPCQ
jgi:hypothetical protein